MQIEAGEGRTEYREIAGQGYLGTVPSIGPETGEERGNKMSRYKVQDKRNCGNRGKEIK